MEDKAINVPLKWHEIDSLIIILRLMQLVKVENKDKLKALEEYLEKYSMKAKKGERNLSIELKNINLKDITLMEQVEKINEEDEEFAAAVIKYDMDNAIEEFYDCMQARLGLLEHLGIDAEDIMKAYPKHLEKLKGRPRKENKHE